MRCKCLLCRKYPRLRLVAIGFVLGVIVMIPPYVKAKQDAADLSAAYDGLFSYWNGTGHYSSHHHGRHHYR